MAIPRHVLSEALQRQLSGRRVLGALFLTFEFDPEFFELQVLPAVLDTPVSHADVARLLQLEADLGELEHGVTVFYDPVGLRTSVAAPRLNIKRFPIRNTKAIFHPKNLLVLTEDRDAGDDGLAARRMVVGTMSANLTRTGWWENVESAHFEDLESGETTRLKDGLEILLNRVNSLTTNQSGRDALRPFVAFVRGLGQDVRKSQDGRLKPHIYVGGIDGGASVSEFLRQHIPRDSGYRLEVISPFFDKAATASPLKHLIAAIQPVETRVYLPRDSAGAAQCSEELFSLVKGTDGATWGSLPADLMAGGRGAEATERTVHAKVYRVFKPVPKTEFVFVGSPNLTAPGHSGAGGNIESGVLVQVEPDSRPDFWLKAESKRPLSFQPRDPDDTVDVDAVLPVQVRFSWKTGVAEIRWDGVSDVALELRGTGPVIVEGLALPRGVWHALSGRTGEALRGELVSSSFLNVRASDGRESRVLVQEDDMPLKPELMQSLPIRDILQYWSLLKPEQRQAFLEKRAHLLAPSEVSQVMVRLDDRETQADDMFQRCAGIFHSFASLETRVREALAAERVGQAAAWVFGERFDSLGSLLDRVVSEHSPGAAESLSDIDRYLILMSGQQLCTELRRDEPDFWASYAPQAKRLQDRLAQRAGVRQRLETAGDGDMGAFLDWFDKWFLRRVAPEVDA